MAKGDDHEDWKGLNVTVSNKESGAVIEYKVHFYRRTDGWYDEVRYDSHEIKKGKKILTPHLHIKIATPFKNPEAGEEELKRLIDNVLPDIKEITQ